MPAPRPSPRLDERRRRTLLGRGVSAALLCALLAGWAPSAAADRGGPVLEPPDWRDRGLAHVDLPFRFRARFDTSYMRHSTWSDRLASRFVGEVGPGRSIDSMLETRVAIARPLADRIELEISWQTRNALTMGDPMAFGRQIVGAFIRITP